MAAYKTGTLIEACNSNLSNLNYQGMPFDKELLTSKSLYLKLNLKLSQLIIKYYWQNAL